MLIGIQRADFGRLASSFRATAMNRGRSIRRLHRRIQVTWDRKRRRLFFRDAVTADWLRRGCAFILASVMCSWFFGLTAARRHQEIPQLQARPEHPGAGGWGRGQGIHRDGAERRRRRAAAASAERLTAHRRHPYRWPADGALRLWARRRVPHPPARPGRELAPLRLRVCPRAVPRDVQPRRSTW